MTPLGLPDVLTLTSQTSRNNETVIMTCIATNLDDVLEVMERFLRGAGYVFDGHLDIVQPDIPNTFEQTES